MAVKRQVVIVFPATGVAARRQIVALADEFLVSVEVPSVAALTPTKDVTVTKLRTMAGAELKRFTGSDITLSLATTAGVLLIPNLGEVESLFRTLPDVLDIELTATDITNPITVVLTVSKKN